MRANTQRTARGHETRGRERGKDKPVGNRDIRRSVEGRGMGRGTRGTQDGHYRDFQELYSFRNFDVQELSGTLHFQELLGSGTLQNIEAGELDYGGHFCKHAKVLRSQATCLLLAKIEILYCCNVGVCTFYHFDN